MSRRPRNPQPPRDDHVILVIDDDQFWLRLVAYALGVVYDEDGISTVPIHVDPNATLTIASRLEGRTPSVIMLDWNLLPDQSPEDTIDLLRALDEAYPLTPIMICSASIDPDGLVAIMHERCFGWHIKAKTADFANAVRACLTEHTHRLAGENMPSAEDVVKRQMRNEMARWRHMGRAAKGVGWSESIFRQRYAG